MQHPPAEERSANVEWDIEQMLCGYDCTENRASALLNHNKFYCRKKNFRHDATLSGKSCAAAFYNRKFILLGKCMALLVLVFGVRGLLLRAAALSGQRSAAKIFVFWVLLFVAETSGGRAEKP